MMIGFQKMYEWKMPKSMAAELPLCM